MKSYLNNKINSIKPLYKLKHKEIDTKLSTFTKEGSPQPENKSKNNQFI